MRVRQDLCIALVVAVSGVGLGKPAARSQADDGLASVEEAMAERDLSAEEVASVRRLIAVARDREAAGDEDGAIAAMASISSILRIA
jgi:hypothetical protein